ncbi:hypothetical protein GCM10025865_07990 [Paraoerskovia sediminicola]|uniref:Type II secretion system protein GspF domain-containing protein n=1 Tax=Paraoerskovia sediminicola TaxID=1138587 RepID=A0ABM8G084_9CELL|nr:type II secretion system F family protein [Paraoerskovia sediminicola]BDZ41500.1 hypothetical protein GCM10025865_07990 [Paraoerskovia sediminicola]
MTGSPATWDLAALWTVGALVVLAAAPWTSGSGAARRRIKRILRASPVDRSAVPEGADGPIALGVLIELLGAAVRAGASLPRALDTVGTAIGAQDGAALRRAGSALVLGASWGEAWDGSPARLGVISDALRATWESGVSPGGALRTAGDELTRGACARVKEASARLGVRLVLPLGVCFLPAFVLVGIVPVLMSLGAGLLDAG